MNNMYLLYGILNIYLEYFNETMSHDKRLLLTHTKTVVIIYCFK